MPGVDDAAGCPGAAIPYTPPLADPLVFPMKPPPFSYYDPRTVTDAIGLLARLDNAKVLAGGQSLMPMLNLRVALIDLLVDISRLDDLKTVTETPDSVWLGALTTHAAIEDGKTPDIFGGLMRRIAGQISYRAVRNHGTLGGSVALADPAADWPCFLIALDATVRIVGRNGVRVEKVAEFIRDSFTTTLTTGDIIMGFDIPAPKAKLRWGGPVAAALGAAGPRALPLTATANQLSLIGSTEEQVRAAIAKDLDTEFAGLDAYQKRMHIANILRAANDMRAQ
jgi:carbon-monoxide dehydrogenase medium subunit